MSEALPLEQKIPVFPYNFLFLAYNQSATSSFSRTTGIQPSTTWRATDIQPSTTFPAPAAQNAFFPTMFHVQPGTTIFPSRKCQTLVGHCPARVCCILFHVEHRRNGISTKQSPRRHSRLGRRLKTRPRHVCSVGPGELISPGTLCLAYPSKVAATSFRYWMMGRCWGHWPSHWPQPTQAEARPLPPSPVNRA